MPAYNVSQPGGTSFSTTTSVLTQFSQPLPSGTIFQKNNPAKKPVAGFVNGIHTFLDQPAPTPSPSPSLPLPTSGQLWPLGYIAPDP